MRAAAIRNNTLGLAITTKVGAVVCAAAMTLSAQTPTTVYAFSGADASQPYSGLIQATDGKLYGTTKNGGLTGTGVVYGIDTSGEFTSVSTFCEQSNCRDGSHPHAGVVQATNGDLYGTNIDHGGVHDTGTLFRVTLGGNLTTLHDFCSVGACEDGAGMYGQLVQASDGYLYGTASVGGAHRKGTAFRITPNGSLTTLYSFCSLDGCADGANPSSALLQASDGNLYGTTPGDAKASGTLFRLTLDGALTTLHTFCSQPDCLDGAVPAGRLLQAADGALYGVTTFGPCNPVCGGGTIFKVTLGGAFTTLSLLGTQSTDGNEPYAGLVQATDGNFYGTTMFGGNNYNRGTIFRFTPDGVFTTLYRFCSLPQCADGGHPRGELVQDTNGDLFGTTSSDGPNGGYGTVFRLSLGLGPFLNPQIPSGRVGTVVRILGANLAGAISVTFNGTPAQFVASNSVIAAKIPAGATSGIIQAQLPSGTLSSYLPFYVVP